MRTINVIQGVHDPLFVENSLYCPALRGVRCLSLIGDLLVEKITFETIIQRYQATLDILRLEIPSYPTHIDTSQIPPLKHLTIGGLE